MTEHLTDTEREAQIAALLIQHQRVPLFDGTDGQRCVGCDHLYGATDGPNSPRHAVHVAALLTAREAAAVEAALAPVRALADEWVRNGRDNPNGAWETAGFRLRAVLPPAPTEGGGDQ